MNQSIIKCNICNKQYAYNKNLQKHIFKLHSNINIEPIIEPIIEPNSESIIELNSESIIEPNSEPIIESNSESINDINKNILEIKDYITCNFPINNQLLNIISEKNKKIEELLAITNNNNNQIIEPQQSTFNGILTINNIEIISRSTDNYINATQMCKAGKKKFAHWYSLDSTKLLINTLKMNIQANIGIPILEQANIGIPILELVESNVGGNHIGTWIHPQLAIQLAQWISPIFALQVSDWIIKLFTTGKVELTQQLQIKEQQLQIKDQEIKLLKDTYQRKQSRKNYPNNVIYIITTKENIKLRIYIIGKATNLKNRLSAYNKTTEHSVVYIKECHNIDTLNICESAVLNKLKHYRVKANVDRFVLPLEHDISFFINIIDQCVYFFN